MSTLADQLQRVQDRMAAAARRAGRDPSEVTLVAVSKTHPPEVILQAVELGVRHFGENRIEEALPKLRAIQSRFAGVPSPIIWHMIGHVQRRKANEVADLFDWVHSVDSLRLAERLDRFAGLRGRMLNVLLEFNLSGEASKYGFRADPDSIRADVLDEVAAMARLPHLQLDGLMTMAPLVAEAEQARPVFRALRALRDRLEQRFPQCRWRHLSMGMTDDFEVAIEEGATLVRLGRAIFGERRSANAEPPPPRSEGRR